MTAETLQLLTTAAMYTTCTAPDFCPEVPPHERCRNCLIAQLLAVIDAQVVPPAAPGAEDATRCYVPDCKGDVVRTDEYGVPSCNAHLHPFDRSLSPRAASPAPAAGSAPDETPDPPHVREDYREVWLSGWRVGRQADPVAGRALEICICAAIRLDDGEVFRGHRHDDAFHTAFKALGKDALRNRTTEQGFITSRNRFVSREEGCELQRAAGIPSATTKQPLKSGQLFSEDLYLRETKGWQLPPQGQEDR